MRTRATRLYKTLVGFESVFPPAWDDPNFDLEGEDAYREQRIDELVADVTRQNAEEWFAMLQRCAQTESNDACDVSELWQVSAKAKSGRSQKLCWVSSTGSANV